MFLKPLMDLSDYKLRKYLGKKKKSVVSGNKIHGDNL